MSVRHGLLALLAEGDRHGYQLRQEFQARTGGTWPLNVGQVYTTLGRLARDGLVEEAGRHDDGSVTYRLTGEGKAELDRWWHTGVDRSTPDRDETAIKLALAVAAPDVDVRGVIQVQREETLRVLRAWTAEKRELGEPVAGETLARVLVLDQLIYTAEAQARWLDHCEQRLAALPRRTS